MKVLVISHNPFSKDENNGRTLYELFSCFKKCNIAQLFFHDDVPDFNICNNYYKITDFDVFKSILNCKKPGKTVELADTKKTKKQQKVYEIGSKKRSYTILGRNLIWSFNAWFTSTLKQWLIKFSPDIIFCYVGNYIFSLKIALKIAGFLNVPVVNYIVDDYYINKKLYSGLFGFINGGLYSFYLKKLLTNRANICINDKMADIYRDKFVGKFYTLYTASSIKPFFDKTPASKIKMSFLGNISHNRYKSIIEIGKAIYSNGLSIDFNIYTGEIREWILEPLLKGVGYTVRGKISYSEVLKIMEDSDILVHVEAFDKKNIDSVRYSFSTKIADSLSSNRTLFAYGPADVASVQYLIKNNCALVATKYEDMVKLLKDISNNPLLICHTRAKAREIAFNKHSSIHNQEKLLKIFQECLSYSNNTKDTIN